ncbi:ATP-binding protein [Abyssalbus ytuae]|uniref:histidine kinase n=1 Tax=Abyssalbus ytuae TaxID=2926907 RepID=A0A9E6ZQA0_9FLAO|nr:tetratricopeptide repeat protein [Abyssalbus ytuae]UOB18530.1 tetratricopeptide repeat protein [Abyssalbus ytuae]
MKIIKLILSVLVCFFLFPSIAQEAPNNQDFIAHTENVNTKQTIDSLILLCDEYRFSDPPKALNYIKDALTISKTCQDNRRIASSYYSLGLLYNQSGNFDLALDSFRNAARFIKKKGDSLSLPIIKCYHQIGMTYFHKNDYPEALSILTDIAEKAQKLDYAHELTLININIALVLYQLKNYTSSIKRLEPYLKKKLDKTTEATIYNNIGMAYQALKETDKALKYYHTSKEICEDIKNNPCELKSLGNIANIYLEQDDYDNAITSLLQIMKLEEALGYKTDLIVTYNSIGVAYRANKNFEEGIKYIHKSEQLAKETKSFNFLKTIYLSLAVAYQENEQYEKAIDYLYSHKYLSDSLLKVEKSKQISELIVKYQTKEKEQEISLLKKDKEIQSILIEKQEVELKRKKLAEILKEQEIAGLKNINNLNLISLQWRKEESEKKMAQLNLLQKDKELQSQVLKNKQFELNEKILERNSIITGFVILLITASIMIFTYHQKLKNKELIASKNEEINKQETLKLLRDQEIKSIKNNIEWQEKERKRISRELHDGIAPSIAAIKLGLLKVKDSHTDDKKLEKLISITDNTYDEIRTISHNFSSPRIINTPFINLIEDYLNEIKDSFSPLKIDFICNCKQKINHIRDEIKVELYRIIQESMSNVVKHSKSDYTLLQLTCSNEYLNLFIEDNGIGFNTYKKSSGIGINSIKSRVNILKGDINIDSAINRGTIININVPY